MATFYPREGHHFVYERWREILGVIVAESHERPRASTSETMRVERLHPDGGVRAGHRR